MSSIKDKGSAMAAGQTSEPTVASKEVHSTVFDASPDTEAAVPAPREEISPATLRLFPAFVRPFLLQSIAQQALPDWNTLGPDSFPTLHHWRSRGNSLLGQPPNDIRVIDVGSNGIATDKGEAAYDQAESLLQQPLPQGSGVCRVIIGSPELGRVDREFARKAVNLAGEKIQGADQDGTKFEKTDFRTRISPAFDLARLRDLWTMEDVAWKPFSFPILSLRTPTERPEMARGPFEGCIRGSARDILYTQLSWILVQTIPLQGGRFLFLCALPSRKFRETTPLQSALDLADIKELTKDVKDAPSASKEQIFDILSRDKEQSCTESFVSLLLSSNSSTRLADGKTDRLCQLLLLDVFRAVSETFIRLNRDMKAIMASLDLPQFYGGNPEKILMELKANCANVEANISHLKLARLGAEHLFEWLSLGNASQHEPDNAVSANERWLKRVKFTLESDLDHSRLDFEMARDFWLQWRTNQEEHIKRVESKNVARLTLLAAVFLPLSFGADLLGMQFRLRELDLILYDYLGLVVSAGLFLFIIHKVVPLLQLMFRAFKTDSPTAKKRTTFRLAVMFFQGNWLLVLVTLWVMFVVSFLIGMTGDVSRSLVFLKYGAITWGALFGLYVLFTLAWGWIASVAWSYLDWNIFG